MTDKAIISILEKNKDFFVMNDFFKNILYTVGWALVKLLNTLCDICQDLYNTVFGLLDFTTWSNFNTYFDSFKIVFEAIAALSIVALGLILIIDHEKKPKLFTSICLASLVFTSSTIILTDLNKIVITGKDAILGTPSSSANIIKDNLYDLVYIDEKVGLKNMDTSKSKNLSTYKYSKLTDKTISAIDIKQVINYKTSFMSTPEAKDILQKKLVTGKIDKNGKASYSLEEIDNGYGWNSEDDADFFNEFYYRYKVDYLPCLIGQIAVALVFFFMSYKVVRLTYEIAIHRILALLYSANLTGTQKTIKILEEIKNEYIVLLVTALVIKLFLLMQTYLSTAIPEQNLIRSFVLIFVAVSAIAGSDLIEKLTGIDAGLTKGVGIAMAGYHMAQGAFHTAQHTAQGVGRFGLGLWRQHKQYDFQRKMLSNSNNMNGNSNAIPPENANGNRTNRNENNVSSNSSKQSNASGQNTNNVNSSGTSSSSETNTQREGNSSGRTPDETNVMPSNAEVENANSINNDSLGTNEQPPSMSKLEPDSLTGFNPDMPQSSNYPDMQQMSKDLSSLKKGVGNTASVPTNTHSTSESQIMRDTSALQTSRPSIDSKRNIDDLQKK